MVIPLPHLLFLGGDVSAGISYLRHSRDKGGGGVWKWDKRLGRVHAQADACIFGARRKAWTQTCGLVFVHSNLCRPDLVRKLNRIIS